MGIEVGFRDGGHGRVQIQVLGRVLGSSFNIVVEFRDRDRGCVLVSGFEVG